MKINKAGDYESVNFWPADEIEAAFTRVNAAMDKPNELEELRLFIRVMNYFYDKAILLDSETENDKNPPCPTGQVHWSPSRLPCSL